VNDIIIKTKEPDQLLLGRACPETGRAEAFLAGASWFARNADVMPPVERELLSTGEAAEVCKPSPVPVDVTQDTRPDAINDDREVSSRVLSSGSIP